MQRQTAVAFVLLDNILLLAGVGSNLLDLDQRLQRNRIGRALCYLTRSCFYGCLLSGMVSGRRPDMALVKLGSGKKRFVIAVVTAALFLLLLAVIWTHRDSDINVVLSRAGLAKLPQSADDVMMSREGDLLDDVCMTFIKFTASQDDIIDFLQDSSIYTQGSIFRGDPGRAFIVKKSFAGSLRSVLRRVLSVRQRSRTIRYPSWWKLVSANPGLLQYRREPDDPDQTVIVDCFTNTVYIRLYHH